MSQKQVFLLYNNESEEDLLIAKNLSAFFSQYHKISLKDTLAGQDLDDTKKVIIESDLLVPLLSIDFLRSENNINLAEAAVVSGKEMYPILSRSCPWQQQPCLQSAAERLLPKEKSLYEYEEKAMDRAYNDVVNTLAEKVIGTSNLKKAPIDPLYKILLGVAIAACAFFIAMAYVYLFTSIDNLMYGSADIVSQIQSYRVPIFIAVILICALIISIVLLQMRRPKFVKTQP